VAVDRGADVLRHGHVGIQLQALERANESGRGSSVRRPARDLQLIQAHGAAAEAGEAGHRVHERGLARSVGADQADDLSRANRKTHRVGRQRGAEHGAGLRAARLAAAGAGADWTALEAWRELVAGPAADAPLVLGGPAVPNGLAIKIYPACYALQRPISAVHGLSLIDPDDVTRIVLRTPEATVAPLIHHRPATGLEAKFSLEYAVAAALLDAHPGFGSFTDAAARRPEAQRLVRLVETRREPGGSWLLDGEIDVEIHTRDGAVGRTRLRYPPGSPQRPPTDGELGAKIDDCLLAAGLPSLDPADWSWNRAPQLLRTHLVASLGWLRLDAGTSGPCR